MLDALPDPLLARCLLGATPILEQARGTPLWDGMTALTPMGRLGRPEEIAVGVAYLASDDASFVPGPELHIDGGYLAR